MRTVAATICWGIAACVATTLPTGLAIARAQKTPTPVTLPYAMVWSVPAPPELPAPRSVTSGRTHLILAGTDGSLAAVRVTDGQPAWVKLGRALDVAPTSGGGLVFTIGAGTLSALDEETGRLRWESALDTTRVFGLWGRWFVFTSQVPPIWRNGWLIAASGTGVRGYRAETGDQLWEQDLRSAVIGTIAIDGDEVFLASADRRLMALNILNGAIRWEQQLEFTPRLVYAANQRIYFGGSDRRFHCFRQSRAGPEMWSIPRVDTIGQAIVDERHVYVTSSDNAVRAFDRDDGGREWLLNLKARPDGQVFLDGGQAIVPLVSGDLKLLIAKSGVEAGVLLAPPKSDAADTVRFEQMDISASGQIFRLTNMTGEVFTLSSYARRTVGVSGMASPPGRELPPLRGRGGRP